jgi:hypothetical protein
MVRYANELDILRLAVLAELYSKEAGNHDSFPFDVGLSIRNVSMAMTSPNNYIGVLIDGCEIIGFLWAVATQMPWSHSTVVFDNILYLLPEKRGGYKAASLIRHYESWCKSVGAVTCSMSTASGIGTDRTCALFERLGYSKVGVQFRKEL